MDANTIVRGRAGIIMPMRNAFDFIERPDVQVPEDEGTGRGIASSKQKGNKAQLKSIMMGLKKKNRANFTNKRMSIVKMDY